jgi:putative inorganic carbon (HCO3(-)) transporter
MLGTGLGIYLPVVLYVGFLAGCLLAIAWRPTIGLYILILAIPQQGPRYRIGYLPLGKHLIVLLLLCVFIGVLIRGYSFPRSTLNKVLILFCAFIFFSFWWGVLSASVTAPFIERFYHWKDYMALPALFFATSATIRTRKQLGTALALVCISVLLVGRGFGLEIRQHDFAHFDENKRDSGPLGLGSNNTAAFEAEMSLVLLAIAIGQKKRARKIFLYGILALSLFCLLFSFSREAYVAFLVSLMAMALIRRRLLGFVVPALVVLLLAWRLVLPQAVTERISMTEDSTGQLDSSAASRLELWSDAAELIASNPIVGSGYDTYEYMGRVGSLRDTHNYYVKAMVETGVIGLFIFLAIVVKFFQTSWTLLKRTQDPLFSSLGLGMVLCTVCIIVVNFFGDRWTYVELNGLVWVLFGLVAYAHSELDSAELATAHQTASAQIRGAFAERTLSRVPS